MANTTTPNKPKSPQWGNSWTDQKLEAFTKYVNAYLTIMDKYKGQYQWKTLYFDGFAGSGDRNIAGKEDDTDTQGRPMLLDFDIEQAEIEVYKGAAERVLELPKKFDYYYFVDLNSESLGKLERKLHRFNLGQKLQFRSGDANQYISSLAEALKQDKKLKALVLLDPFGMQINWESINLLKGTNSDIWILVPSGVIINRLLYRNGQMKRAYINKLCAFFGLTEQRIIAEFYTKTTQSTLFGEETNIQKKDQAIKKIAELYIKRLKEIWSDVLDTPLVMTNTKNIAIFHFVFASNNSNAKKIAKEIVSK